ncbi:septum site-determining protein MinC [Synechococcus sp. MIT S9504]|uniref:septum site-determining protein MinC n=1 Tax=Synechococcus sp. MIT S9504 TaxID=1801628 RepID=UPI0007BB71BB|nr:septum site-determining protein MinC [Synechococcus sp. MIT S9504]KZR86440.1 Septum site-determining protein MinC [Synechococcus sp. MIT S9504]
MTVEPTPQIPYCLSLPAFRSVSWQKWLPAQLPSLPSGDIDLDTGDWSLSCRDLEELLHALHQAGHNVQLLITRCRTTLISAAALGLPVREASTVIPTLEARDDQPNEAKTNVDLTVHRGTLRSGDHIETQGHLLIVGDVNPGGSASAEGDVYVWGRLRGRAHAGSKGNSTAKIVALQLRPLQLRIAELVARGPEERPQPGLAEQACILDGAISIEPASAPFTPQ